MAYVTVRDVQARLALDICAGDAGLDRKIYKSDISRPGLEMAGFFNYYPRIVFNYWEKRKWRFSRSWSQKKSRSMQKLCTSLTPAIVVAHGVEVPEELLIAANEAQIPVFNTSTATTRFSGMLTNYLEGKLAPMTTMHGVLVDVYGVGVLITGKSGVGKSETALELVKRGHRLVADDLVEIREVSSKCTNREFPATD